MENHSTGDNSIFGFFCTALSMFSSIIGWITIKDAQAGFGIGASIVAMISGGFAIRHYIKQDKKQKS